MGQVVVEGFVPSGSAPAPAFYVGLNLLGLTMDQVRRVRSEAERVVDRYESRERAVIVNAYRGVVEACDRRLGARRDPQTPLRPNVWLLRVAPDPTDPWDQIKDDRGTAVAFALTLAEDPDPAIAAVWRGFAEGFDLLRFHG